MNAIDDDDDDDGHRVVKLGLSSSLALNAFRKQLFSLTTRTFVQTCSEIAQYGSIVMTALIAKCVRDNVDVPSNFLSHLFLDQAFNSNFRNTPHRITRSNILQDTVREIGNDLDNTSNGHGIHTILYGIEGHAQLRNYVARGYKGNIVTMIKAGWKPRISDHITAHLMTRHAGASKALCSRIRKEIMRRILRPTGNPANNAPPMDHHALELIQFHRDGYRVNGTSPINDYTFNNERNYHHFVTHFGKCLRLIEELEALNPGMEFKKRYTVPQHKFDRVSIQIDKKILYFIIKKIRGDYDDAALGDGPVQVGGAQGFPISAADFDEDHYYYWCRYLFRLHDLKILTGRRQFQKGGVGFTSDGVSVSIHYRQVPDEDLENEELRNCNLNVGLNDHDQDGDLHEDEDDDLVEDEDDQLASGIRSLGLGGSGGGDGGGDSGDGGGDGGGNGGGNGGGLGTLSIAIDPGQDNVLYLVGFNDNGDIIFEGRLGRNNYYEVTKINAIIKRANRWNSSPVHQPLNTALSIHHFKTANLETIKDAIVWRSQNYDHLWDVKVRPQKFARQRFFLYCQKRKVIHKFLASLRIPGYDVYRIFYGDGSFPSGGRGRKSVPCKWVKQECMRMYDCTVVDEFRTSQVCPYCFERLETVYKLQDAKRKEVRGLKYPDYRINDYSDGVCTNERPLPSGRVTYGSQLACCLGAYGSQTSGKCLASLPSPPTTAPTKIGGLDVYYPDYTKGFSKGVCVNDGPMPLPGSRPLFASQEACCSTVYGSQSDFTCMCDMKNPPSFCTQLAIQAELDSAICLYQRDFDKGSKIINRPGTWKLCEDITFAPGKPALTDSDEMIANAFDPVAVGGSPYDKNEFALGFFAALIIQAKDVTLLLNGYTIQQDPSHALMQRFFAVIELASSPFIPNVGPSSFVSEEFVPAENFVLKGPGIVGLSSHHGIHGNNNKDIIITDVVFRDFEVAAVSLNNVDGLTIEHCKIPHNRLDVPVLGSFSAAKFILPYIRSLKADNFAMELKGSSTSATTVYNNLVTAIANVYRDVMKSGFIDNSEHPVEHALFHNVRKLVDGPCYSFLVHGKGPAVGGQGFEMSTDSTTLSSNIKIIGNSIDFIKCWTNEIPGIVIDPANGLRRRLDGSSGPAGVVQNDARGAMLQYINTITNELLISSPAGLYTGNSVADAQIMVASAVHDGALDANDHILQTQVNTLDPTLVAWAAGTTHINPSDFHLRCNGDSMHHVIKGSIMIRVEDTEGFVISDNTIGKVSVVSFPAAGTAAYFAQFPSTQTPAWTCSDYHKGASLEDGDTQQLGNIRGISVAAVSSHLDASNSKSIISGNLITNFESEHAVHIVGIDVQGKSSGVVVSGNTVNLKSGVGKAATDKYIGCRVRAYADHGDVTKINNVIVQEDLFERVAARSLRSSWRNLPGHQDVDENLTEWDFGGCPYGNPNIARRRNWA